MSDPLTRQQERRAMPVLETVGTIVAAIELFSKIPKLASVVKHAGIDTVALLKAKPAVPGPLKVVIQNEIKKVNETIDAYYRLDSNAKYSELEKDEHRRRLAARLCALLRQLVPIKDNVPDYDKLIELFCDSIPKELAA